MLEVITALVTPMLSDGSIDVCGLKQLVEFQIGSGINGIVIAGTTGEVSTLTTEEHLHIIQLVHQQVNNRTKVIAGTGSNSTHEAIELTNQVKGLGVSTVLQVVPYYNKPSQSGLYNHFKKISESVDIDNIVYNVPSRTGVSLSFETIKKLLTLPNIIGVKDTRINMCTLHKIKLDVKGGRALIFSGDDSTFIASAQLGVNGVISVLANLFPQELVGMAENLFIHQSSLQELTKYVALCREVFVESNPVPIKWVLARAGLVKDSLRLPLFLLKREHQVPYLKKILTFKL
jgi:4-hydroxy-tetrahydrodipicolinate synthase